MKPLPPSGNEQSISVSLQLGRPVEVLSLQYLQRLFCGMKSLEQNTDKADSRTVHLAISKEARNGFLSYVKLYLWKSSLACNERKEDFCMAPLQR